MDNHLDDKFNTRVLAINFLVFIFVTVVSLGSALSFIVSRPSAHTSTGAGRGLPHRTGVQMVGKRCYGKVAGEEIGCM